MDSVYKLKELLEFGFINEEEYQKRLEGLENFQQGIPIIDPLENASYNDSNDSHYSTESNYSDNLSSQSSLPEYSSKPEEVKIKETQETNLKIRTVRVFISSTFLDMQEERSLLMKSVFPELRKIFSQRGVDFIPIDFRWGITAEDASGGKVISLCLNEIDKCRPYFIGILGERYGWSQAKDFIKDRLLEQSFESAASQFPWILDYKDRSVTEIEMLYGALFYPVKRKFQKELCSSRALFYLKNPNYQVSNSGLSETEKQRLSDLKRRVKKSGLVALENYSSPREVADHILSTFKTIIEKDFPLSEVLSPYQKESKAHQNFTEDQSKVYVGRKTYWRTLDSHVHSTDQIPLIISGSSASGKSSLLAKWINKKYKAKPTDVLFFHFIGLLHNDPEKTVLRLILFLKSSFQLEKSIPEDKDQLLHNLAEWIVLASKEASQNGKRIIIVLDGIDYLDNSNLNWFPLQFPSNVRVIISCAKESASFQICKERNWNKLLSLQPLEEKEKRKLINKYLQRFSKKLSSEQVHRLAWASQTSNPLFLKNVVEQLILLGDFEKLSQQLQVFLKVPDLSRLYEQILTLWEAEYAQQYPNLVQDVMCLLYLSHTGLLESELEGMLSISQRSVWSSLWYMLGLNSVDGLIYLNQKFLQEAIQRRYLSKPNSEVRFHKLIADYFHPLPFSSRKALEYPYHLAKLKDSNRMATFLYDIKVFQALYTPLDKYELFSYWKVASNLIQATEIYTSLLATLSLNDREKIELHYKLGSFALEIGQPLQAIPLLENCIELTNKIYGSQSEELAALYYKLGQVLLEAADYKRAIERTNQALKLRENIYGSTHFKYADCIALLALLQKKLANYDEAAKLYNQAISLLQSHFGEAHPSVALSKKNLADVKRKQANYEEAGVLYQIALKHLRESFGESPEVADCLDCLGRIAKKEGKYDEAYALYSDALRIMEKVYGKDNSKLAETLSNLGDVFRKLAKFSESIEYYERALKLFITNLGENHPEVAQVLNSLGMTYKSKGQGKEAISFIERAIAITEKTLGTDHLNIAAFANNLADVYSITGKYKEAVALYYRAFQINKKALGPKHPEVSENLNALGMIAKKRGDFDRAEKFYFEALNIIKEVYGPEHGKAALIMHNLGVICRKKKKLDEAWDYYQKAMKINEKIFGHKHPIIAGNLRGLGLTLKQKGTDLDAACEYHLKALEIVKNALGPNSDQLALSLNDLAEVYRKQGRVGYDGAEKLYLEALEINRYNFGSEHPEIAENLNGLAQVYKAQMNYLKAEPVFKEAIEMTINLLGEGSPHVVNRYRNLADLYERMGRIEDAEKVRKIIEALKNNAKEDDLFVGIEI